MEQLYDYKMVENRSIVEQAHEFQALAKELELFPCPLPDKFVAGGKRSIILRPIKLKLRTNLRGK
jgi:hypothetical protein